MNVKDQSQRPTYNKDLSAITLRHNNKHTCRAKQVELKN